ncbi:hypothetical protein CAFE_10190 [Caprobacter fermentans]|uniref:Uncharacterized protein n=2 Tax=Caproicibacter fermentans TaxID=2576756 RepID=A0A6N8HX00_9FIRM|nr:DUF6483 family protein [Caproicibacter fermentans]MVB10336.1 hypothetical protein [Caproicibacter fermentans]
MFQEDWVMRQIESIVNFLTEAVLDKKTPDFEISETERNDTDRLHERLLNLIRGKRINEAEDLLFERLDTGDRRYLELAVDFYARLNKLDGETLRDSDFSRSEIEDGLKDIASRFGIPLADLFQSMHGEEN